MRVLEKTVLEKLKTILINWLRFLTRVPNLFIKIGVGFVKLLDRYGMLSRKTIDASPFHTKLFHYKFKINKDRLYLPSFI